MMSDATTQETPPGLIRWRDELRPRRAGILLNLRDLECIDGHSVEIHGRIGTGGLQCHHRDGTNHPICGAYVFLIFMSSDAVHHRKRRFWVADMLLSEIEAVEREQLDPEEILLRFGGIFPPGRRQSPRSPPPRGIARPPVVCR